MSNFFALDERIAVQPKTYRSYFVAKPLEFLVYKEIPINEINLALYLFKK